MSDQLDRSTVESLVEGTLPWEELKDDILPDPKDPNRFEAVREFLQDSVGWDETILVPLNDHLYVVNKEGERTVKAECGHELCDASANWKRHTEVRVREDKDEFSELYPREQTPDPSWSFQVREFYCPECYSLLEVEAVPKGYPVHQKFSPDVDAFYQDWLDRAVPE